MNIEIRPEPEYGIRLTQLLLNFFRKHFSEQFDALKNADMFMNEHVSEDEGELLLGIPVIFSDELFIDGELVSEGQSQSLCSFLGRIKELAAEKYVKNKRGFVRMAVPPRSAYDYIPHHIKHTKEDLRTVALLYE